MYTLQVKYQALCNKKSDINEHLEFKKFLKYKLSILFNNIYKSLVCW